MRWSRSALTLATTVTLLVLIVVTLSHRNTPDQGQVTRAVPTGVTSSEPTSSGPSSGPRAVGTPTPAPRPPARSSTPQPHPPAASSPGSLPTRLRQPARPRLRAPEKLPTLEFNVASFNVLGASHTDGPGARPGYASGTVRARQAAQLLHRHGADVVGFQELQVDQLRTLRSSTDLDFYPGLSLGRLGAENSIGWRRGEWAAVDQRVVHIPYFDGGPRVMPVVRLRNVGTGVEAWFANFHNPAETRQFRGQQRWRTQATLIEARLANLLISTGLPVFITGDMNERAAYFCRLTSRAPMVAARGGSNVAGRCRAGGPPQVDWIFGSQGVQFTGYGEDDSPFVDRTSDHPLVTARARIQAATAAPTERPGD